VFSSVSPSTSAISDCVDWMMRLQRAFGSPNFAHLHGAVRLGPLPRVASTRTAPGARPVHARPRPSRCILFWGYNPSVSRLAHATARGPRCGRGAKLVVVDPRRAGLATKADHWLRVRPGTDAALALAMTHVMIEQGWYDDDFVRRWTDAPLLVRTDTGRLLRADDLFRTATRATSWPGTARRTARRATTRRPRRYEVDDQPAGAAGTVEVSTPPAESLPTPVFELVARAVSPAIARSPKRSPACPAADDRAGRPDPLGVTARWPSTSWSGLEQHSGTPPRSSERSTAVRADRLSRRARRQRAVHARADERRSTAWTSFPTQRGRRPSGVDNRPLGPAGSSSSPARTSTRGARGPALPGARPGELRREPADGPRRQRRGRDALRRSTSTSTSTCS
jgi:anaerobic selenocysteine-containing dehydrogenase